MSREPVVGVLALQGDFEAHARDAARPRRRGARGPHARRPRGLDGLVIPGGESTTMTLGIEREGLAEPLRELGGPGTPVLGTCAGMIMLDREHLGIADYTCARNAFGRQIRSFEADLEIPGVDGEPVRAVFIRAPWIDEHGPGGRGPRRRRRPRRRRAAGQHAGDLLPPGDRGGDPAARAVPARRRRPRVKRPQAPLRPPRRVARQRVRQGGSERPPTGTGCPSAAGSRPAAWAGGSRARGSR